MTLQLSDADMLEIEREYCTRSLSRFAKRAWHVLEPAAELKWGWALDAICEHLQAVSSGQIKRLRINVPPGCMKSLLTSVLWGAWEWGALGRQSLSIIGTAHSQDLAIRDSRKTRLLIKSQWYQRLWPIEFAKDLDGKIEFGNTKQGVRAAYAFTGMTGRRGDRVILDDPISAFDANSDAALKAARLAFTETLPTRVNNSDSAIVVIMQRLNENDVCGVIDELALDYESLILPMRYEECFKSKTCIGFSDPRTKDGELLFPERFSEQDVVSLEKTLGSYGAAGQLQQRPSPRGGGLIQVNWFRMYHNAPLDIDFRVIFADTAQKTGEQNDFSVMQCWGRTSTGQAILLDQIRGKWEAPELLVQARAFYLKHRSDAALSPLRGMAVEDKVSGTGLIQTLRREGIAILPIQRSKDKYSRACDAAPFIECGNVLLPAFAPWLSDFLAEIEKFPSGAHDDQIDPMCDAIQYVQTAPAVSLDAGIRAKPVSKGWRQ